jgi:hypothetical protein
MLRRCQGSSLKAYSCLGESDTIGSQGRNHLRQEAIFPAKQPYSTVRGEYLDLLIPVYL